MGWKGNLVDIPLGIAARLTPVRQSPGAPESIFVLRNNDIGDLLVVTPLFDALRRRFPQARIVAGIGSWNRETIRGNPHLSGTIELEAPWNNRYVADQGWPAIVRYLAVSPDIRRLQAERFDVGIDVLGSHVGSALLLRAGIPWRLGVRGYRGGHTAVRQWVEYDANEQVGRSALRFAELLGATDLPEVRPQIFLTDAERREGGRRWSDAPGRGPAGPRIAIGVGGGFAEKCWPVERFREFVALLGREMDARIVLLGGPSDALIAESVRADDPGVVNRAGRLSLRETFACIAASDAVVTNPSMLMHAAAAFRKPTVVALGEYFPSAAQHDAQWGYPSTCVSLRLPLPPEILSALGGLMERTPGGS